MNRTDPFAHRGEASSYLRFLWRSVGVSTDGNVLFYTWMTVLTTIVLVGVSAWVQETTHGMYITGMSDHVSWGLYISNFTFLVGLAAGAVAMVIPAYLFHDRDMHQTVIVGEILAVAAITMALLFVLVDIGRIDRFWHMIPGPGRFNWPISMLSWDVIALGGYLVINAHVAGYLIYQKYLGQRPRRRWYLPFVMLSIVWAVSIHTVTAFLYAGLGGRPFWNSALLAPRFLASAFVAGPAFVIISLQILRRMTRFPVGQGALELLMQILRVSAIVNLFMLGSELFTEFYTGGSHTASARYLWFGLHGHSGLVPWIWTALALNLGAVLLLLRANTGDRIRWLNLACCMTFFGVWIEKGMGLIVAGFIPSTLHELVEYQPSIIEWRVMMGIWALGLMIFTLGLKLMAAVNIGEIRQSNEEEPSA
jgi:molybdopterin-containing oxidoreductase family membrane subunit